MSPTLQSICTQQTRNRTEQHGNEFELVFGLLDQLLGLTAANLALNHLIVAVAGIDHALTIFGDFFGIDAVR